LDKKQFLFIATQLYRAETIGVISRASSDMTLRKKRFEAGSIVTAVRQITPGVVFDALHNPGELTEKRKLALQRLSPILPWYDRKARKAAMSLGQQQ
jgi:hypothetical protein